MKKFILTTVAIYFSMFVMFAPMAASAKEGIDQATTMLTNSVGKDKTGLTDNFEGMIATIVKAALVLVGTIFLLLTIYAGVLWMTARGEAEQIEKAQKIISATVIGLFITMGAYTITYFITSRLSGQTDSGAAAGSNTNPANPNSTPVNGSSGIQDCFADKKGTCTKKGLSCAGSWTSQGQWGCKPDEFCCAP